jgi:PAS domain S-box-containing protein
LVSPKLNKVDIIKGISAGLCLLDRDFRIIWVNQHQSDWFGLPKDILGKHCYKIFQHRPRVCPGCPTCKVFKTGVTQIAKSARGFTKEGQRRYYQLTVSPIKDNSGRVIYALELVQDITERFVRERYNRKITQRIKRMYQRLSLVNKRLNSNLSRVREIIKTMHKSHLALKDRYKKEKNHLMTLKKELQDIFKINRTLSSSMDSQKITSLITRLTCELMRTDACILRLMEEDNKTLVIGSSHGTSRDFLKKASKYIIKVGESISGIVAKTRKPLAIYDVNKDSRLRCKGLLKKEGFRSVLCVPVIFQDKVLGAISAYSKKARHFQDEEMEILSIFASQVALALQESRYYEDIHLNYFNTIHTLALALESRDVYSRGHTERVTKYAIQIGRALEVSNQELEILRYAAQVHDIGKISIPDYILNKPGRLTPDERAVIELHPVKGAEVLEPLEFLKPAIPIVRHHHERYDGTGYPDGLEKERIPLMSRILACADAFDAMTSQRPYRRRRLTIREALEEIKNNSGSQFDPKISHLFIRVIQTQVPA